MIMKKGTLMVTLTLIFGASVSCMAAEGVAIQRVITNTRSELGQLASSSKARAIAELMKRFDTQYQTWSNSCGGGENFDPKRASDACKAMADQMRETGIALYGELAEYLPDVAARYEQGARSAGKIVQACAYDQSPYDLYCATMGGVAGEDPPRKAPGHSDSGSPFDLEIDNFPDPTEKMFAVLETLVPDFGKQIPDAVRAGNAQISMMKKARSARFLADQFSKAKLVLESQRDYGEIIFNTTKAVSAMPEILGIQYTGTQLKAVPNKSVLDYYRTGTTREESTPEEGRAIGGFEPRT